MARSIGLKGLLPVATLLASALTASAQLTITPATFPTATVAQVLSNGPGTVNVAIGQGGIPPYNWNLVSGTLPPGVSLSASTPDDSTGAVTGTITAPGTFTYTIQAIDSSTPALTATITYTTVVTVGALAITPASLPGAVVGSDYGIAAAVPAATAGQPPYSWTLVSGTLPPGVSLAPKTSYAADTSLPNFALSGTPTSPGTYSFTLQVTDSSPTPLTTNQTFALSVVSFQQYPEPSSAGPAGITTGPDGALWYTGGPVGPPDPSGAPENVIGSVTTAGTFGTDYPLPDVSVNGVTSPPQAQLIVTGSDGALWFTEPLGLVGQMSTSGNVGLQYAVLPPGQSVTLPPAGIAPGPDGAIWFTVFNPFPPPAYAAIGRIATTSDHTATYYPITANSISKPNGIVAGPDGALWFTDVVQDQNGNAIGAIGRIMPNGSISPPPGCASPTLECPVPGTQGPQFLAAGPDGAIWFSDAITNQIGRITTDGKSISLYQIPTANAAAGEIVAGSDGALWFFEAGVSKVGRITTAGVITEFAVGVTPQGITSGPDGALWLTDGTNVDRLVPSIALACNLPSSLDVGSPLASNTGCPAFGGTAPYSYSVSNGSLPPGLTLNPATGALSGSSSTPGSYSFTILATDSTGQPANQVFNVTVAPRTPLTFSCTFPTGAQVTQPYTATCTTSGGIPPYTYSVSAGTLPAGLTLTPTATGLSISGTPTAYGTSSFTIKAADSGTPQFTATQQAASFVVAPPPLYIACNFSAQAEVNVPYLSSCTATGGVPPYNFTFPAATTPPAGLSITPSNGQITGTPTAAGTANFVVTVNDSGPPVQTISTPATLTVIPAKLGMMCDFTKIGVVGTAYATACATTNGVAPYAFKIVNGKLPPGMAIASSTGAISGTPTAAGSFPFTIQVTDNDAPAQTAIQNVNLSIQPVTLTITSSTLPNGAMNLPYSGNPIAKGGTGPYTWSLASGTLPAGLKLNAGSGAITGTPTGSGSFSFTLQVTDSSAAKQTATQLFSGTISAPVVENFAEYPLPASSGVDGITPGSDGALWFSTLNQPAGNLIGRSSTAGAIITYPAPNPLAAAGIPGGIVTGPDGTLWFTEENSERIGQITTDGKFSIDYPVTTTTANPQQITAGPDGALWFTESGAGQIGQMSTSGVTLNEYATPTAASVPSGIVVGPDNAIWFAESAVNNIGRITTDGQTKTEYAIPTAHSNPTSIALGPDGALWFTENGASKIGRISGTGQISEFVTPTSKSGPTGIVAGADGTLYFTEATANQIGRITTDGVVTEYVVPTAASGLEGITLGPDGAIWISEGTANKIARFSFVSQIMLTCTFPPSGTKVALGTAYNGSCTATRGTPPYTFSVSKGALPPGVTLDPASGALSGTITGPGAFTFTVEVSDSSEPAQSATQTAPAFTVLPGPLSLSCSFPLGQTDTPYSGTCTPSGGTAPFTYSVSAGSLPTGLSLDPSSGTVAGGPTAPGTFNFSIQISDSGSPVQTATQATSIVIQLGGSGNGGSLFTFGNLPASQPPATSLTNVNLQIAQTFPVALQGTVTLGFAPYSGDANGNLPNGYVDPAMQFVDSSGNKLGLTYNFTIPAGATSVPLPAIDPGTVAGGITLTVNSGAVQTTSPPMYVNAAVPTVEPGSVHITNVTANSFDVEFVVTDVLMNGTQATFTFTPSQGAVLQGLDSFTIDVSAPLNSWYSTTPALNNGGVFLLAVPFPFSGPASAIGSVSVTIGNAIGMSQPVSGTQ